MLCKRIIGFIPVTMLVLFAVTRMNFPDWIIQIFILLYSLFAVEFIKKGLYWGYLDIRGRVLFIVILVTFLICISLPIKENMTIGVRVMMFLVGYLISWSVVFIWGSDKAKEKLLWPKIRHKSLL